MGYEPLPVEAFSTKGFHCGFMTTEKSQALLQYQRHTIDDYFMAVKKKVAFSRLFVLLFKPLARKYLLNRSHYYKDYLKLIHPKSLKLTKLSLIF
jgi:hypothetical protein